MAVENETAEISWGQRHKTPSMCVVLILQALSWAILDIKVLRRHTVCVYYSLIKFWPGLTENFAVYGKRIRYCVGLGLLPHTRCELYLSDKAAWMLLCPSSPLHFLCEGKEEEGKKCNFEKKVCFLSDLLNGRCMSRSRNELIVNSPARGTLKREQYIFSLANIYF